MTVSPAVLAVLGLGVLAWASSASSAAVPARPPSGGSLHGREQVEARRTGGTDAHAWTRQRVAETTRVLEAQGYSRDVARRTAIALVAQWARESGWGRAEWNFNVGNIKASNWGGPYHRLSDGQYYRAYGSLAEGIADTLRLHQSGRYRAAWDGLIASGDPVAWYDGIMRAGYHPWSQEALSDMRQIAARVAAEPVAGATLAADIGAWVACVEEQCR